jgi:hypothetical protein
LDRLSNLLLHQWNLVPVRILGPAGNPRTDNLFAIVSFLQRRERARFEIKATRA